MPDVPPPLGTGLGEWRKKASFDVREMQYILGGGEDNVKFREEIFAILEKDSLFQKDYRMLSTDEYRQITHKRWKRIIDYKFAGDPYADYEHHNALMESLMMFDHGLCARFGLHVNVFLGAQRAMGTQRHRKITEMAETNQIVGCFCLTELTHGSNSQLYSYSLQAIQTTATFGNGEFVFHTPTEAAMKTYEGENNILVQQAANYIIKQSEEGFASSPMGTIDFLGRKPTVYNGWKEGGAAKNVEHSFEFLLLHLLDKTRKELEEKKRQGRDAFTARNEVQLNSAHPLAIAYADLILIRWAREAVEELQDEKCKRVLNNCVNLFALSLLQQNNHLASLYIGGYCSGGEFGTRVREEQIAAEEALYPDAVALVDAVAPPDFALHSALGASDGRPYEHLVEEFYRHEGKRATFPDDLSSILLQKAKI